MNDWLFFAIKSPRAVLPATKFATYSAGSRSNDGVRIGEYLSKIAAASLIYEASRGCEKKIAN